VVSKIICQSRRKDEGLSALSKVKGYFEKVGGEWRAKRGKKKLGLGAT
jgi:hypothetical protein